MPVPGHSAYQVVELRLVSHEPLRKNAVPDRACRRDAGVRAGGGPVGIRSLTADR
jgi:hypothetical protein